MNISLLILIICALVVFIAVTVIIYIVVGICKALRSEDERLKHFRDNLDNF